MSYHTLSKSTKRRRFLEEIETVDFLIDNQLESNPQPSTSHGSLSSLPLESSNLTDSVDCTSNNLFSVETPLNYISDNSVFDQNDFSYNSYSDTDESDSNEISIFNDEQLMLNSLAKWKVNYSITSVAFSSLLKILKEHNCFNNFPVDSRTVMKTNKYDMTHQIQTVNSGLYYHFGISNGLMSVYDLSVFEEVIKLVVGIDGLPLTKSSSSTFWPVLAYARYPPNKPNVFIVGLYWGKEKPQCSNLYLRSMVDELKSLSLNGFKTEYGIKFVVLDTICCDLPARSFITRTKNFNGYYSCSRCVIEGDRVNNTTCFLGTNYSKRTHTDFLNRIDDEHHVTNDISILTEIPHINMVNSFSLDYMHMGCLGVMKKLILLWLGMIKNAPLSVRIQSRDVSNISKHILSIKPFVTNDFPRKLRGLNEVARYKATEFKFILVYVGAIILKGAITEECYNHFISLHVSFRILLSLNSNKKLVGFAEKLLVYFVETFEEIYGAQFSSHNIHSLIHLADDYRNYGSLDNCSCFPFENFMKFLKVMVRKHEKPLEQVINRYREFLTFNVPTVDTNQSKIIYKKEHCKGPLVECYTSPQYQIIFKNNIKINIKSLSDIYIGFKKQNKLCIFKVFNICYDPSTNNTVFLCKMFNHVSSFFCKPIDSIKLGIAIVDDLSTNFTAIDIEHTNFCKYMIIFDNLNNSIAYPIIHSYEF